MILFVVVALIAFTARLAAAEPNAEEVLDEDSSIIGAADSASFDPTWSDVGAAEARDVGRQRNASLGRVDLTVTWRRTVRIEEVHGTPADPSSHAGSAIASAIEPVTTARGVLWVLLTWSR